MTPFTLTDAQLDAALAPATTLPVSGRCACGRPLHGFGTGCDPAYDPDAALAPSLPRTIAGRQETLDRWYHGVPLVDDEGRPSGEYTAPLIDRATYLRLLDAPPMPEPEHLSPPDVVCSCHPGEAANPEACPTCGSLSPEKCAQPCRDRPCGAYRAVDDVPVACNVCPVIALESARFNAAFGSRGVATCPKCGACPPSSNQERK